MKLANAVKLTRQLFQDVLTFDSKIANLFQMDDATWARHANPWSVFTRTAVLPLLIVAVWSRIWIGWWSLGLVAIALLWNWINPRLFPKPQSTDNWASKAVLGERVWINRDTVPIPDHHRQFPNWLNAISFLCLLSVIWGLVTLSIWPTLMGFVLTLVGKFCFLDRMVWLYSEMKDTTPEYQSWLY